MRNKSASAAHLCDWILNINQYYQTIQGMLKGGLSTLDVPQASPAKKTGSSSKKKRTGSGRSRGSAQAEANPE